MFNEEEKSDGCGILNDLEKRLDEIFGTEENDQDLETAEVSTQCKSTKKFLRRIRLRKNIY